MGLSQRLFGRRRALWPTLGGIVGFALLVGGEPSVLRCGHGCALCDRRNPEPAQHSVGQFGRGLLGDDVAQPFNVVGCRFPVEQRRNGQLDPFHAKCYHLVCQTLA